MMLHCIEGLLVRGAGGRLLGASSSLASSSMNGFRSLQAKATVGAHSTFSCHSATSTFRGLATESRSMLGSNTASTTQILGPTAEAQMQKIKVKYDQADGASSGSILRKAWRLVARTIVAGTAVSAAGALYYSQYELKELDAMVADVRQKLDDTIAQHTPHFKPPFVEGNSSPEGSAPPEVQPEADQSVEMSLQQQVETTATETWLKAMNTYITARRNVTGRIKEFSDPTYHKLLPDLQPELRGRIKTLVLDLDELLVYKEWTRQKGWLIYKRPGAQDFLKELGQYFELVVYTDEPNTWADPVINKLDPQRFIQYRLYRPETQYHNGKHVRDLSKLNRDMGEVLFLSAIPEAWEFQPENTIKLKAWKGQVDDTMLLDMIPFLQLIATKGVRDVRDVVRAYDGVDDIPRAFRERMKQLSEHSKAAPTKRGFLNWQK